MPLDIAAIDFHRLQYFLAVAEELHFGRAAKRLHIRQPPLSQQIQRLEADLGVQLFDRSNRRVRLTDAGRVLLVEGRRILDDAERAVDAVQRASRGDLGHLTIGFISSASYEILPVALGRFRQEHPGVRLTVQEAGSSEQVERLRAGHMDVAFLRSPSALVDDVSVETIAMEHIVAALPKGHPLARQDSVALASLASEPFISYPGSQAKTFSQQLQAACLQEGFSPNILLEATPIPAIVGLVAAGLGVAPLPASATFIGLPGVIYKRFDPPIFNLDMAVAWRTDACSELVAAFLNVLREAMQTSPLTAFTQP
jgi:DNA-binding transcriptional LysR family regulator